MAPLDEPPFGTNMAFRKVMFEKYGGFRLDLGPTTQGDHRQWYSAGIPRTSEDTEFGWRLMAAGEKLRYEASGRRSSSGAREPSEKKLLLGMAL